MSNGVFNTPRSLSVQERVQLLAQQKAARQSNLTALIESAKNEMLDSNMNKKLSVVEEAAIIETNRSTALENMAATNTAAKRTSGLINLEARLVQEGIQMLWKKVLFESVYAATWIDEPVKKGLMGPMYETFESTLGFVKTVCPNAVTTRPTKLLECINGIVTEAAKKAAKRITKEAVDNPNSDPDKIDFSLSDTEEDDFDKDLSDLDVDSIEKKVKDKVLTVIQDEKQAGKKKAETMKELDKAKKEDDDDSDDIEDDDESDDEPAEDDDKDDKKSKEDDSDDGKKDKKKKSDDDSSDEGDDKDDGPDDADNKGDDKDKGDKKDTKKKKDDDKNDDDKNDDVVEESVLNKTAPDDYYKTISDLYTALYKKSAGNNASDTSIKFTKSARVDATDFKMLKISKRTSFARAVNVPFDTAKQIVKSKGFKLGTAKAFGAGQYYIKKLRDGYCEVRITDVYKSELANSGSTFGSINGNPAYVNGTGYNYVKQTQVAAWYRPKANASMRERYLIEGTIVKGKSEALIAMESKAIADTERKLNNSHGRTIFESMMMFNRVGVEHDCVLEGTQLDEGNMMNAAMMESILQYTVLETLNTMKIFEFKTGDSMALRKALLEDMNILSVDNGTCGPKSTRINTLKFKRNNDKKLMSSDFSSGISNSNTAVSESINDIFDGIKDKFANIIGKFNNSKHNISNDDIANTISTMLDVASNGKSILPPAGYKSIELTTEEESIVKTSVETLLCQPASSHIDNGPLSKGYRIVFVHDGHRTSELFLVSVVTNFPGVWYIGVIYKKAGKLLIDPLYCGGKYNPKELKIEMSETTTGKFTTK